MIKKVAFYYLKMNIVKFVFKIYVNERKKDSYQKIYGFFREIFK
jgi:hypothetical protein